MAAADKQNDGWLPLSQAASTDEGRQLIKSGRCLVRYPYKRRYAQPQWRPALWVQEWRVGLPENFLQFGRFDWAQSAVAHDGRTLQGIEILFPNDALPAAVSEEPVVVISSPSPFADQTVVESAVQRNAPEADLTDFLKTLPPKCTQTEMLNKARTHFAPRTIPVRLFTTAYKKLPDECKRQPGETNRTIARKDNNTTR
jgi:hypothetical protein